MNATALPRLTASVAVLVLVAPLAGAAQTSDDQFPGVALAAARVAAVTGPAHHTKAAAPAHAQRHATPAVSHGPEDQAALQATLIAIQERLQERNGDQQAQINELRSEIAQLKAMRAAGVVGPVSAPALASVRSPAANANATAARATQSEQVAAAAPAGPSSVAAGALNAPEQVAVTTAPQDASVQSVYQQQNALFHKNFTLTPSITRAYSDNRFFTLNGFLALNSIFLGNVNVTQQESDITELGINGQYGVTDRLQLEAQVPYFLRSTTFSSVGANYSGEAPSQDTVSGNGIGDVLAGGYYQVEREHDGVPSVTFNGHVSVPTGRSPYGIKLISDKSNSNLEFPGILPTGSGVYGYEVGASFVKTSDPAIFFGGANVYFNQPNHFADISSSATTRQPGTAQPGSAFQYQIGTAFALNEKTSLSFAFDDITTDETALQPDNGKRQTVIGSGTNAAYLSISAGYAKNAKQTVITEFDLGLTQDAPNFQINLRVPTR